MASDGLPHQVMRSMLKVIERFSMHAQQVHRLEYAARALLNAAPKRAFLTWAGMRAQVLAQRRAVVWLAVQRGHRVGTLQEMFEEIRETSAVDDLLQMTDELGMTPLLWASKRGFADIVEVRAPRWGPLRLMGFAWLPTLSPHLPTSPHVLSAHPRRLPPSLPPGLSNTLQATPSGAAGESGAASSAWGFGVSGLIERRAVMYGLSTPEPPLATALLALLDALLSPRAGARMTVADAARRLDELVAGGEAGDTWGDR